MRLQHRVLTKQRTNKVHNTIEHANLQSQKYKILEYEDIKYQEKILNEDTNYLL